MAETPGLATLLRKMFELQLKQGPLALSGRVRPESIEQMEQALQPDSSVRGYLTKPIRMDIQHRSRQIYDSNPLGCQNIPIALSATVTLLPS